jgi:malate dehydrogenase (oxaloacetate-decarboxylating)(NADP+)
MGSRIPKISPEEEQDFLDELMTALTERWPGIVIQFEDFKNPFPALERYKDVYTCFNDDVQGTGAVIVGGFINAVKASGTPVKDHRAVFLGTGSAGVGVARQIVEYFIQEGLTEEEARRKFWFVDSKGLVTLDRGDKLAEHKVYFARNDNDGKQIQSLSRLIDYVKPTILMGLSTIGGAFNSDILGRMTELNNKPIIFPLSNPSSKSECTFEEAVKCTEGRALFASGSPFPSLEFNGKTLTPGQGNNMYVFPGIGLGAILSKAVNITQDMIYASAESLSTSLNTDEVAAGWLYPDIRRIREVSVIVTRGVIRAAQKNGVDRELSLRNLTDEQLDLYIKDRMYDPHRERKHVEDEVAQLIATASSGAHATTNGHANGLAMRGSHL